MDRLCTAIQETCFVIHMYHWACLMESDFFLLDCGLAVFILFFSFSLLFPLVDTDRCDWYIYSDLVRFCAWAYELRVWTQR